MTMLDLNYISPKLMAAQGLEVTVPGTYDPKARASNAHMTLRNNRTVSDERSDQNRIRTPPLGGDNVEAETKKDIHAR